MILKRKTFHAFLILVFAYLSSVQTGYPAEEICEVISPRNLDTLQSFPVNVIVQFNHGPKPETFRASLNGIDITGKFRKVKNGTSMLIQAEDGLNISVKTDHDRKLNVLNIKIQGLRPEQHLDLDTLFFVEADKLATIGVEGGAIQSVDGNILINIPQNALSSNTTIALTKVRGSGKIGGIYQLAPEGIRTHQPVMVAMKYDPMKLPKGVMEDDLFLLSGYEFPEKMEDIFVDKKNHTVNGIVMSFSKVSMSYYSGIGKKLTDIPYVDSFRFPIGDDSNISYSCGHEYQLPSEHDLGETLTLLHRSLYPDSGYPKITFNENTVTNTWRVITGYNRKKHIQSLSEHNRDSELWYLGDKSIYSQGESWSFTDQDNDQLRLPIHAMADGLIIYSDQDYISTIVVAHRTPNGPIVTVYTPNSEKSLCAVGTVIRKGNVIGMINRIGGTSPYFYYEIGKKPLQVDAETGEIKVPATWYGNWTFESVRKYFFDPTNFLMNSAGKYKWDFNVKGNDEGWIVENAKEYKNGYMFRVRDGMLSVKPGSDNMRIASYPIKMETEHVDSVFIRMKSNALDGHGKIYFITGKEPNYSEDKAVKFEILNDGRFHEYRVFMADIPKWEGTLVGIRIDFPDTVIDGTSEMNFDSIRLGRAYFSRTPDTGQTKCYDNIQEITCPAPGKPFFGQDAHYSNNPPNYEVKTLNGHEVVIDHVTGLTWQRHHDETKRTWQEAMEYCENLSLDEYPGWRLPTKKELQTIINYGYFGPVADTSYFPYSLLPDDYYWSSTTRAFLALSAQKVCYWNSELIPSHKSEYSYVRAVRGRPLEYGHFIDNRDGTVTDITTDLMWQQTETKAMTWEKALAYCEGLDLAGHNDWRLPNTRELLRLVNDTRQDPSINTAYFPRCRPSPYWTSTTHTRYPSSAWYVSFNDGQVRGSLKSRRFYVRAVRGGE